MTEHIREMSARSRQSLPKNRIEFVAWIIARGGLGMIFLLLLIAVWWQGEKRNDEMRDLVKANVAAFQQVSNDLKSQRELYLDSCVRMRETADVITDELKDIRRSLPASTTAH